MSCRGRFVVPADSIRLSILAEAVCGNRSSERMASSNRSASADAAGITSAPHAVSFNVFMPLRSPRMGLYPPSPAALRRAAAKARAVAGRADRALRRVAAANAITGGAVPAPAAPPGPADPPPPDPGRHLVGAPAGEGVLARDHLVEHDAE